MHAGNGAPDESLRFGEEFVRASMQRVTDIVDLAAAESRLAALSGLTMILCVIFAATALVITWGLLIGCVLFLFSKSSIGWPVPAFCLAVGHAVLAYYLWQQTVRLSWNLTLPELRATLTTKPPTSEVPHDGGALVPDRP
jgi:DNA-binding IclR family transcriptional regulator